MPTTQGSMPFFRYPSRTSTPMCPPTSPPFRRSRALRFRALARARRTWSIALALFATGCGEQEDWSPLDGPWDPDHPDAAAILAAPVPGSDVDPEMVEAGERWYRVRGCLACHTLDGTEVVGPSLQGVTLRREYPWFRGMVMRPDSMFRENPVAQQLLEIYRVPMPNQGVDELRTRAMWEYLRELDR